MFTTLKYVILTDGVVRTSIKGDLIAHCDMVGPGETAASAGEVIFEQLIHDEFTCRVHGSSTTLGVQSRPEDAEAIMQHFINCSERFR